MSNRKKSRKRMSDDDLENDDDDSGLDNDESGAKWACQLCTFINRKAAFRCFVCGTRKGTSTRKSRMSENVVEMQKTINDMVIKQVEKEKSLKKKEKTTFMGPSTSVSFSPEQSFSLSPNLNIKSSSAEEQEDIKRTKDKKTSQSNKREMSHCESAETPNKKKRHTPVQISNISKEEENISRLDIGSNSLSKIQSISTPVFSDNSSSNNLKSSKIENLQHVSPTTSRQSSETDSSSDTARSLEPPSEDHVIHKHVKSTKIPDNMIYREIPKKITVFANGIPAVFYEFPKRLPEHKFLGSGKPV